MTGVQTCALPIWREREEREAREQMEDMEVDGQEEEEEEDNKDVLYVNPSRADMAEWRDRVVDVRERDRLDEEEKKRAAASSQVANVNDLRNDVTNAASTTPRGQTQESPSKGERQQIPPNFEEDCDMGEETEDDLLGGEDLPEGDDSYAEDARKIERFCQKEDINPLSNRQMVKLTASLIDLRQSLREETSFRVESDSGSEREKNKSKKGEGIKNKKKKGEREFSETEPKEQISDKEEKGEALQNWETPGQIGRVVMYEGDSTDLIHVSQ